MNQEITLKFSYLKMKALYFVTLLLICGCSTNNIKEQKTDKAILNVRITSPKLTYKIGEPVTIKIMMQKLVDQNVMACDAYWSAIVKVNNKEFRKKQAKYQVWNGYEFVPKNNEIGIGLALSQYGISEKILSVGTHKIEVSIGRDVSNILTVRVID